MNNQELKASPAQREAICFTEGTMLVLAGPGSGKTHVITQRIRYLIEEKGVYPGQILTITFTKSAALEMKQRCLQICPAASGAVFGTFHSIFYQILRNSEKYRNYSLISNYEKRNIMKQLLTVNGFADGLDSVKLLSRCDEFLSKISYRKNTGYTMQKEEQLSTGRETEQVGEETKDKNIDKNIDKNEDENIDKAEENIFRLIMEKYRKECESRQLLDFDDMLVLCYKLLTENPSERARWQSYFRYILIDEVQDVNGVQYEMAKLLSARYKNLFVVGDDDQAIYSFRGSDPLYMRKFLEDFPESKVVRLSDNYRCGDKIVELAAKCISHNSRRFEKEIKAATKGENEADIRCFETKEKEMAFLCEKVRDCEKVRTSEENNISNSAKSNSVAILLRTNAAAEYVAQCLSGKRIPYHMREKQKCFFDNPYVEDILSILRFVFRKSLRKDFYCFMNKPERGISRESIKTEVVDFSVLKETYGAESELGQTFRRLEKHCMFLRGLDTYACINYILQGMKYREYLDMKLRGEEREKAREVMEELLFRSKDYRSVEEFLSFVELYKKELEESHREGIITKGTPGRIQPVQIMTYHGAKGLEFDRVFLPGINSGIVPHGHILTMDQMEEERRMFYVAMTRARNYLCISYVKGEKDGDDVISPFVSELMGKKDYTGDVCLQNPAIKI